MCTYNGARFLDEQLASIVAQTRLPDELVICDDCSTDKTRALLTTFAATSPIKIKLKINQVRLGSTRNFQQAIRLCEGDIIALCDQDDVWLPGKLALTEGVFTTTAADLVFTDGELVDESGQSLNYRLWEAYRVDADKLRSDTAYELLDRREAITGTTMAFRSCYKELVLPIPENIPLIHDGWISLLIAHVGNLYPINEPLIKYRQHSAQQLGAPTKNLDHRSGLVESARRETDFDQELRRMEAAQQRLTEFAEDFAVVGLENMEAILKHFRVRKAVSQRKFSHLPEMFSELIGGRYHRYSNGFSSFVKDLVK
ncbi:MAG TPA: glycosyltransferase family 2 protein [Pyrinomonadaceae bacterium]